MDDVVLFVDGSTLSLEDVAGVPSALSPPSVGSARPCGRTRVPKVAQLREVSAEAPL